MRCLVALGIASLAGLAYARPLAADTGLHAGLNLRADTGAHAFRGNVGFDTGPIDISLALDPMVITDGQLDTDLLATVKLSDAGWGLLVGWRTTAIGILGGREYQEKLMLGVGAPLPRLGDLPLRLRWGFEGAAVIVKHGADLPTDWISFDQGRDFVDLLNFGMFVTIECCSAQ